MDESIKKGEPFVFATLLPIKPTTLDAVRKKYEAGGWVVTITPFRTPNGYRVGLS